MAGLTQLTALDASCKQEYGNSQRFFRFIGDIVGPLSGLTGAPSFYLVMSATQQIL